MCKTMPSKPMGRKQDLLFTHEKWIRHIRLQGYSYQQIADELEHRHELSVSRLTVKKFLENCDELQRKKTKK